jgi:IS30 family transposase
VERLLDERWSPQQIARPLVLDHPEEPEMRVSHETIYQAMFVQARGTLRKELTTGHGQLLDMALISERRPR